MKLKQIKHTRPDEYSSQEWNILDVWYDLGFKFISLVSLDGKVVAIEKQYCDEILQSNFYESNLKLDTKDKDDSIVFWCHKESKSMINE
ncbi:MAG: hypothetical protein ACRC18_06935 [Cetobacterium sp.]